MSADPLQQAISDAREAQQRHGGAVCKLCGQARWRHRNWDQACPASADGTRYRTSRFEKEES